MLYGKIINGTVSVISSASKLEYDAKIVINPREEDFLAAGYSVMPTTERPEEVEDYFYSSSYQIVDGEIVQVWTANAIEEDEDEINESI